VAGGMGARRKSAHGSLAEGGPNKIEVEGGSTSHFRTD